MIREMTFGERGLTKGGLLYCIIVISFKLCHIVWTVCNGVHLGKSFIFKIIHVLSNDKYANEKMM